MKAITGILLAGFLALFLAGCGRESSKQSWTEDNSTDQLYSETQADTEIFLFQINGRVYTVDGVYPVDRFIDEEMEDGGFYRITADCLSPRIRDESGLEGRRLDLAVQQRNRQG